jgi:hypothetical protein
MEILGDYLGCEVTFIVAPQEVAPVDEPHDLTRYDGNGLWVNVPLLFDRSQVGWLRAALKEPSEFALQLLILGGRITACILWEQSRAQRAWLKVLEGEPVGEEELGEAARGLGWPAVTSVGVLAAYLSGASSSYGCEATTNGGSVWQRCSLPLERTRHLRTLSFSRGPAVAVFAPLSDAESAREAVALRRLATSLQSTLSSRQRGDCAVGIGGVTTHLHLLPQLWRVASRSLEWGVALHGRDSVTSAESFGILGLLVDHVPGIHLKGVCQRIIGPLLEHDSKRGTDFCQTLQVYLNCDGHFGEAAKLLFVHENTLRHRIKRIQETLPVDLSDPYARAAVFLCLKLNHLGVAGPALPGIRAAGP